MRQNKTNKHNFIFMAACRKSMFPSVATTEDTSDTEYLDEVLLGCIEQQKLFCGENKPAH